MRSKTLKSFINWLSKKMQAITHALEARSSEIKGLRLDLNPALDKQKKLPVPSQKTSPANEISTQTAIVAPLKALEVGDRMKDGTVVIAVDLKNDNALFVPEIGSDKGYARHIYDVLGRQGIGFAPFGLDYSGFSNYPLGARVVNAATVENFAVPYRQLAPMAREWAKLSFENKVWGAGEADDRKPETLSLGGRWTATLIYGEWQMGTVGKSWLGITEPVPNREIPDGGAVFAQLAPNEFLLVGHHVRVSFGSAKGERFMLARVEEGHFEKGNWVFDRVWNGDQTGSGINLTDIPQTLKVKLAAY